MFFKHFAGLYCISNMNLSISLFFGIFCTVCAIYKIPEYDICVLRVLLCDDFTKPLTPVDNSTLEMFKSIGQLNAVCDELSKFRICLKDAEKFCKENADLDVGFELLNNRRLAFDLCEHGSAHQHVYMMVEGCVNKYSHSVIEFCTDKAVETVGLNFYLGDFESECRFLGAIQHCHIAVVTDQCGSIAGNMLEKLVVFRGERDFMCIGYEEEKQKNLEAFYATMDSYVQQYRNTVYQIETEDEAETIDGVKNFQTPPQEASSQFHSRISPIPEEYLASDNEYTNNREQRFNLEMCYCTDKRPLCTCLLDNKILDTAYTSQNAAQPTRRFYEQRTSKVLSENYACKTKASFLLMGIRPNGEHYQLGYGEADVLWARYSPLKDISCSWMVNPSASMPLAKCLILIDNSLVARKDCKRKMEGVSPFNATIAVYETIKEREAKRVAELKVSSFLKYSSKFEGRLGNVINFFKNHAHDIRFWCAEHHEANLYKEPNRVHSTSRMGFLPSDVYKSGVVSRQSRISDQKNNFYKPEQLEYPVDTEIHLISSEEGNLENEFEVGDNYASENYDETLNPFLSKQMFNEKNYDEPFTPRPSTPPKSPSSSHSYRPYELFRPRVGEIVEDELNEMSSKDLGIKDAAESNFNPNVLSFEDATENDYASYLYDEICPVLPENISKLVKEPCRYSRVNYMNIADPLDTVESKSYEKFSFSKTEKDIPFSNMIWRAEESGNIVTDNKQNRYEEIYVVTPSTVIESSSEPNRTESKDADIQNLDDNFQILNKDDGQHFVEIPQESNSKDLTSEKDFITKSMNSKSSRVRFLGFISNYQNDKHPFSGKFINAPTNHEVASDDQFSPKSEVIFSRRSRQRYATEMDENLFNAFEVLAKVKLNVMRIRKILRETRMEKNKTASLKKTEL